MRIIALYLDGARYVLEDSAAILSRANQALATLERYKLRLDEVSGALSALEIEDLATVRDVTAVAQRLEMVRRIAAEIEGYMVELGTDGRLLALQLDELIAGQRQRARSWWCRTTCRRRPAARADQRRPGARPSWSGCPRTSCSTWPRWPTVLGFGGSGRPGRPGRARAGTGCWPRCRGCPGRWPSGWSTHFGGLQKLLAASVADLQAVDGVAEPQARAVREGLSRLAESSILLSGTSWNGLGRARSRRGHDRPAALSARAGSRHRAARPRFPLYAVAV